MKILSGTKRKVMVGVLALGVIGTGAVASNFGFINQLANILGKSTDKAAEVVAGQVTNRAADNKTYEGKITEDVDNAANKVKTELVGHATGEMNRGKGEVQAHYDQLKTDINTTATDAINSGKTKITNSVNSKVATVKSDMEDAAVDAINAQLNADTLITGTDTVSK